MKKKTICVTIIVVIFISCVGLVLLGNKLKKITNLEIKEYCMKHNVCHANDFYVKKIDNYYFAVSVGGDNNMSEQLMIFQQCKNDSNEVNVFGGYNPVKGKERNAYSWYESTFPEADGKSIGDKMIIFSSNREKAVKGMVFLKENDQTIRKEYKLNSEPPFIICIEQLGTIDDITRDVVGMSFYDEMGNEIQQIVDVQ